jgi:hypothetical protein
MFDLRYHVASLAAVFIALIIGILVGVGLAGSGVTKDAELQKIKLENAALNVGLDQANAQIQSLAKTQNAFKLAYPALMTNRLAGKRVAVLFIGRVDANISGWIDRTLADAGAPPSLRLRAISVPVNPAAIDKALVRGRPVFAKYIGDDRLGLLGRALASEFVLGGQTPLWTLLSHQLVQELHSSAKPRADAVIVVRTAKAQQGATARFLTALLTGLGAGGINVVGVEDGATTPSTVPSFAKRNISTVDDIGQPVGRLALALLLNGATAGHYGVKDSATAVLPPVEPVASAGG